MLKAFRKGKRVTLPKSLLVARYRDSTILSAIHPNREKNWLVPTKRDPRGNYRDIELNGFSFIDNPQGTLEAFKQISIVECRAIKAQIHFDDAYCIDIGSYLLLAEIWPFLSNVYVGGRMDPAVQKVLVAVGLGRALGMQLAGVRDLKDVWAFSLARRRPSLSSRASDRELFPQRRERVADDFCNAVDDWLGEAASLELTPEGKARFALIMGELLCNAERHSEPISKDGSWSVAAFMARRTEDGTEVFRCYMGFLSVGASIADSLRHAPPDVTEQVDAYCHLHRSAGRSAETLATLFALQDGITCDADAREADRGGIGLQDVMEFVSLVGQTRAIGRAPRITIVSGRSCIQLRLPYIRGERRTDNGQRVLWCNDENSPAHPPDPTFVFDLDNRLAGTIVALSFVIDQEHLKASIHGPNRPNGAD